MLNDTVSIHGLKKTYAAAAGGDTNLASYFEHRYGADEQVMPRYLE
jgi:hypothetical protein